MVHELMTPSGIVLRRDAIRLGYDDNALARLVRGGVLVRMRQGAYADTQVWAPAGASARHGLLCEAVQLQYDDDIALSHDSAGIRLGGPSYGLDLSSVHVTHLEKMTGRRNVAGVVHHEGSCRVMDLTRDRHGWLTDAARTILDIAMVRGLEAGIVQADDLIRRGLTSKEELWQIYDCVKDWPGALILRLVIDRCDGKAESVGETLGRELFRRHLVPMPILQLEVFRPDGTLAGRPDWAWPEHGLFGEFDGKVKYLRYRRENESIEDAVLREKQREDDIRELTDFRFIRLVWSDLFQGARTAERVRAKLLRTAA
jgi:hypothetical protein